MLRCPTDEKHTSFIYEGTVRGQFYLDADGKPDYLLHGYEAEREGTDDVSCSTCGATAIEEEG